MYKLTKNLLVPSLIAVASFSATAADAKKEECDKLTEDCPAVFNGSAELGYVSVTGNKDTESLNTRLSATYEVNKWRHSGFLSVVTSSTEEEVGGVVVESDTRKFTAQAKTDYKFSDRAYAFGIVDYDDTKYSGFDYQMSFALGLGYSFIKDDIQTLDGEIGFGRRTSKTETVPSVTNDETITRIAGKYTRKLSETSLFEQHLSTEIGDDNTITKSYTGLSAKMLENLALKVSYSLKHQSDVPPGVNKRETITAFNVVYSF